MEGKAARKECLQRKLLQRVTWAKFYGGKLGKRWKMHFRDLYHLEKRARLFTHQLPEIIAWRLIRRGCSFPVISVLPVPEKVFRHGNSMAAGHHPEHHKMQGLKDLGGSLTASATSIFSFSFPLCLCNILKKIPILSNFLIQKLSVIPSLWFYPNLKSLTWFTCSVFFFFFFFMAKPNQSKPNKNYPQKIVNWGCCMVRWWIKDA